MAGFLILPGIFAGAVLTGLYLEYKIAVILFAFTDTTAVLKGRKGRCIL